MGAGGDARAGDRRWRTGTRLVDGGTTAAVARAGEWPGVEQVTLTVVTGNASARGLYVRHGFLSFGVEPRALRDDSRHYDMEYLWRPLDAAR